MQTGQHDSVEDARAALELAALKFRHGRLWGCGGQGGGGSRSERLMNVLAAAGCRATLVDRPQVPPTWLFFLSPQRLRTLGSSLECMKRYFQGINSGDESTVFRA